MCLTHTMTAGRSGIRQPGHTTGRITLTPRPATPPPSRKQPHHLTYLTALHTCKAPGNRSSADIYDTAGCPYTFPSDGYHSTLQTLRIWPVFDSHHDCRTYGHQTIGSHNWAPHSHVSSCYATSTSKATSSPHVIHRI
jgi:hypothetical protein